jgi:hypothetical protein
MSFNPGRIAARMSDFLSGVNCTGVPVKFSGEYTDIPALMLPYIVDRRLAASCLLRSFAVRRAKAFRA